jgi:hypothetical protein
MKLLLTTCAAAFYACGLTALLAGCFLDISAEEDVLVLFPSLPPEAREKFGEPAFKLTLTARSGKQEEVFIPAGNSSATLSLPQDRTVPITLKPVFQGQEELFLPAGGLYPQGLHEDGKLPLTWEGGFAAAFLQKLTASSYPVGAFNAGRFFRETLLRGGIDPWALDEELIITTLAGLSFRADRIKLRPSHPVSLSPIPAGKWLPQNPTARPVEAAEETASFGYLSEGYHRYYHAATPRKLDIHVKSRANILFTVTE